MQSAASVETHGGYRSPSGDRSFYPTSVFKRAEVVDTNGAGRSPSPPAFPSCERTQARMNGGSAPLLHRYRVGTLNAPARGDRTRSVSVNRSAAAADEPRTAPRLLTRSAQPPLQRRGFSPIAFSTKEESEDEEKRASTEKNVSPPIMPRSREAQRKSSSTTTTTVAASSPQQTQKDRSKPSVANLDVNKTPAQRSVQTGGWTSPSHGSSARRRPLPCDDAPCIHSRESIAEFIRMQRELRLCYAAMDQHDAEVTELRTALATERATREQAETDSAAERQVLERQYEEAVSQLEAELSAHWQERVDAAAAASTNAASDIATSDAEIERLHRVLSRQQEDSARAHAAQQEVIQNLQRTVREYDAEVVRLEDTVNAAKAELTAATDACDHLSRRVHVLEQERAARHALLTNPTQEGHFPNYSPTHSPDASGMTPTHADSPATATTTPSKRFGRFRVLTPDASPAHPLTSTPLRLATAGEVSPSPSSPSTYVLHGGQRRPPVPPPSPSPSMRTGDAATQTEGQHTSPRRTAVCPSQAAESNRHGEKRPEDEERDWRRAAKEAEDRCKELLRALLDKESQIAKMGAERTRFKRLYEESRHADPS